VLWNGFFQTCALFKKIHHMCKHCLVLFSISSFGMFLVCFNVARLFFVYRRICPSPCHPFICFIYYFFPFFPHVFIFSKCWKGSNRLSFLWHSQGFVVFSHILSNMLEINVYLVIDSNVFGVKIGDNFPFGHCKREACCINQKLVV